MATPAQLIPILRSDYLDGCLDAAATESVAEATTAYKTSFLLREIGTAQRQACWRGDMKRLFDNETPEVCSIALVTGQSTYNIDRRVLMIEEAMYNDGVELCPLRHTTRQAMNSQYGIRWRNWPAGFPRGFFINGRKLYLDREPSAAEAGTTIDMAVWREPLSTPDMHQELEIDIDPQPLASWVTYRALLRPNRDEYDPQLAQTHLQAFNDYFGEPLSRPQRDERLSFPERMDVMTGNAVFGAYSHGFDYCNR